MLLARDVDGGEATNCLVHFYKSTSTSPSMYSEKRQALRRLYALTNVLKRNVCININ